MAQNTVTFDPNAVEFPTRRNLPFIEGAPKDAAWFWGEDDNLGRINLLTPARVSSASKLIESGEIVPVNLPLNVPGQPNFGRETFHHEIKTLLEDVAYDDLYHMNTQSGTQWDGFRHFAHVETKSFYNNTRGSDVVGPNANHKCSMHHWAEHGIAGRGVLLDFRAYAKAVGLDYSTSDSYRISYEDLVKCGQHQGIDIRPSAQGGDIQVGDILFVRSGWTESYHQTTSEENTRLGLRHFECYDNGDAGISRYAGLKQEENMLDWLHDCYFSAVAGDSPTFEAWPTNQKYLLHEYLLALWGVPIGEMLDLEKLAQKCSEKKKWFFFFSSAPFNCPGGVSTYVNGNVIL